MSSHLIERQIFQIGLEREQSFETLSRELSNLLNQEIIPALDEILSEFIPAETVWRIPRVELDLGIIALPDFSSVFAQRFREKLRDLMLQSNPKKFPQPQNLDLPDRYLQLLRAFFLSGYNPWWAAKNEQDYDAMMREVINLRKMATTNMIFETAIFRHPRRRIIYNLEEDTLYRLFDILSPDPQQFFKNYVEDLIRVNRFKRIVKEEEQKVKFVVQELILLYLTEHKDTGINQLSFLRRQLLQLSRYYQIPYQTLLNYIQRALKAYNLLDKRDSIGPLILQLGKEAKMPAFLESIVAEADDLDILSTFLQQGRFSVSGFYGSTGYILNQLFSRILQTQPEQLSGLLFELGKNPSVRKRLIHLLSEEGIRNMFKLLAPSLLNSIYAYFQLAEQVMVHTPAVNQEKAAYRKTVQELTLKVLVEKLRGQTDNQVFLRAQLSEFALKYGLDYTRLLQMLLADLRAIASPNIGVRSFIHQIRLLVGQVAEYFSPIDKAFLVVKNEREIILQSLLERAKKIMPDNEALRNQISAFARKSGLDYQGLLQMLLAELQAISAPPVRVKMLMQQIKFLLAESEKKGINLPTERTQYPQKGVSENKESLKAKISSSNALRIAQLEKWLEALKAEGFTIALNDSGIPFAITEDETLISVVQKFLAKTAGTEVKKQQALAQALFSRSFKRKAMEPGQSDELLQVLYKLGFGASLSSSATRAYGDFLKLLRTNRSKFTTNERIRLLQIISQPPSFSYTWVALILEILEYPNIELWRKWGQVMINFLKNAPSIEKNQFWHFVAIQLHSEKKGGARPLNIIATSIRYLATITRQPAENLKLTIVRSSSDPGLVEWLKKIKITENKVYEYKIISSTKQIFRLSLADLLSFLGEETLGVSDEDLEVMLELRLSEPEKFVDDLRILRHHPGLLPLLLENISLEEAELLLKSMLKERYSDWKAQWQDWRKAQSTSGIFRLAPEALDRELMAWSFHYFLMQGDFATDLRDFSTFLLEKWQTTGQLDQKRILRLLGDEEKAVAVPSTLRTSLEALAFSRRLQPLHISAVFKQREIDVLEFWLRFGRSPEWWLEELELSVFSPEKLHKLLKTIDKEIAVRLVQATIEGKSASDFYQVLGISGRSQLFRLIQPQSTGVKLDDFFMALLDALKLWNPEWLSADAEGKLFQKFLHSRAWDLGNSDEIRQWLNLQFGAEFRDFLKARAKTGNYVGLFDFIEPELIFEQESDDEVVAKPTFWLAAIQRFLIEEPGNYLGSNLDWNSLPKLLNKWTDLQKRAFFSGLAPMLSSKRAMQRFASIFSNQAKTEWMAQQMKAMPLSSRLYAQIRNLKLSATQWEMLWPNWFDLVFLRRLDDKNTSRRMLEILRQTYSDKTTAIRNLLDVNASDQIGITLRNLIQAQIGLSENEDLLLSEKETVLQYFLQFGTLPTSYANWSEPELREALLELLNKGNQFARRLLFDAWKWRNSRGYLLQLLQPEDFYSVISWIHPALGGMLEKLSAVLKKAGNPPLEEILQWKTPSEKGIFLLDLWTKDRSVFADPDIMLKSIFQSYSNGLRMLPRLLIHQVATDAVKKTPEEHKVLKTLDAIIESEEVKKELQKREQAEQPPAEPGESVHVYNAGLCLIWPYIGRLFRLLDMVEGNDFKSEALRMRAVQLTQYISTGIAETPEAALALNKVLCGMDLNSAVEPFLDITEQEHNLIESMLNGVLQNWNEMQGTSVPTFRESFLQREGRLALREGFWELAVEKKAFDVLLTTLPWQIRTIKLAWMQLPLQVLWI